MVKIKLTVLCDRLIAATRLLCVTLAFLVFMPDRAVAQSFDDAVGEVAGELAEQAKEKGSRYLAVVGFAELNGYESAMTDLLSEELVTAFFSEGSFNVVERSQMSRVLDEFEGYAGGNFDEGSIAELQKLLGVDAIVTGSVARLGNSARVNARIIDMETAQVFGAASTSFSIDESIEQLFSQSSSRKSSQRSNVGDLPPTQSAFRNNFYAVIPTAVSVLENGQSLKVTAELRNLTSEPLRIASRNYIPDRSAISNRGSQIRLGLPAGISTNGGSTKAEAYTEIAPGSSTIVSWSGRAAGHLATIEGSTVNLREILYVHTSRAVVPTQVNLEKLRIE